ncbi:hypothetical protein E2C01_047457 [Portunus trituberculatus]|uniref:Uncharacterized protein n=1 Tax=Portunus trituberculatus TaxID=210409 RepID=A0A5B7G8L7_PORTR|nr:hypothetical protein [Portunus trituberculatus]
MWSESVPQVTLAHFEQSPLSQESKSPLQDDCIVKSCGVETFYSPPWTCSSTSLKMPVKLVTQVVTRH